MSERNKRPASENSDEIPENKKVCPQLNSADVNPSQSTSVSDVQNALAHFSQIIANYMRDNQGLSLPPEIQSQVNGVLNLLPPNIAETNDDDDDTVNETMTNDVMDFVHPDLFAFLKGHQKEAIKFLFNRVIGKHGKIMPKGRGAILAHNMGLGKSFTIITFLHAVLSNENMNKKISKVLLLCPKNVIAHWKTELRDWIDVPGRRLADNITISCLDNPSKHTRIHEVKQWFDCKEKNQIIIIGYEMFGNLVKQSDECERCLQNPGPDLVIFDEAHRLKNEETQGYKSAIKIKTCRKIFLTGTPFQNNLMEFYHMLKLVAPRILKSKDSFKNYFSEPIEMGRAKDACAAHVRIMKIRCKLLHKKTKDVVHRKDVNVLINELDKDKTEATFMVRPSAIQKQLVEAYLTRVDPMTGCSAKRNAVKDHPIISKMLTHPDLFYEYANKNVNPTIDWMDINFERLKGKQYDLNLSNKLMLLIEIIKYAEKEGDKILVFSQSLQTLNYIEDTLNSMSSTWQTNSFGEADNNNSQPLQSWGWNVGVDYLRIDGGVDSYSRHAYQDIFNKSLNRQCRLLLISTKAGSLGTNMIGANRVVIFDACWNPTHDIQSLYRVYRLGQKKAVFIYRLVTSGTMEEIVYNRQIAKEATSHRVIDEENIDRHFTVEELEHLYRFKYVPVDGPPTIKGNFNDPLISQLVEAHENAIVSVVSHNSFFDDFNEDEVSEMDVTRGEEEYERKLSDDHTTDESSSDVSDF